MPCICLECWATSDSHLGCSKMPRCSILRLLFLSCCVVPCLCHVVLCRAVPCCAVLCCAVLCRPYAEFMAAKKATSTALAEAVCRVGWSLRSSAAGAVADSRILTMSDAPSVCCRAGLWAFSSCIVNSEASAVADAAAGASDSLVHLQHAVVREAKLARQDAQVATDMPAAYAWLELLIE